MNLERTELTPGQTRAALALAEALIPGNATIPAADEDTLRRVEAVVAHMGPTFVKLFAVSQQALSAAAVAQTGRPFHALGRARQDALLARWEKDPVLRGPVSLVSLLYKFVHFDRPTVYRAMGGRLATVQPSLEQPRWLQQVHRAEAWAEPGDVECDVVVVGTGAGGAVVGRELADGGHAVVFLEEGEYHRRDAFTGSSVDAHTKFYRGAVSVGNAPMPVFMGRLVGGSTAINGGTCFRTPPWVLDRWCEDIDTDAFAPEAMARHFERVESVLQVAPSARKYIGPIADIVARGCDALGWSHFAINRNAPGCEASGFCDFGCRSDARRSTNLSYVPPALEKGAVLFTGLRAERVLIENGRAVGVEGVARNGRRLRVRARAVVFAGGAVPTPLFLLKQGICNRSGQVGRNLSLHPSNGIHGLFDEEIAGTKYIPQGYGVDHFLRDGILVLGAQSDVNFGGLVFTSTGRRLMDAMTLWPRMATFGVLIRDAAQSGRVWFDVGGMPAITYSMNGEDVARMHRGLVHTGEFLRAAGARAIYPVVIGADPITTDAGWERFKRTPPSASEFALTSYHPLGTCRMGKNPATSVVGIDHQTHDVRGLFLVDGSTVPSALGVNPQLTIMAMANRAAEHVAAFLG